ncbi:MAG: T9SS type A sorting domain-containing protein [Bacteroidetes bacterium]|nr:T9SS type A sorting domain-containing protein [Bacteroidota bacterium]
MKLSKIMYALETKTGPTLNDRRSRRSNSPILRHSIIPSFCYLLVMTAGLLSFARSASAQYAIKWMDIGSFQSWYSSAGSEYEEQRVLVQQDGCRWPAIYANQDMEAAKGIWIGVRNWTDPKDQSVWPYKVVHFGPRPNGDASEFVPQEMTTTDRFALPQVLVDGNPSYNIPPDVDNTNASQKMDRLINDSVRTYIGLTMVRKMIGFSQQFHDNYVIYDYTFINTSSQPLDSIRILFQYRYAVCAETRYVIGTNSSGWGINEDNSVSGVDGPSPANTFFGGQVLKSEPVDKYDDVRAIYSWHGNYKSSGYDFNVPGMPGLGGGAPTSDNIGGPIWLNSSAQPGPPANDTTGRLGAAQFIGICTIHADKSATDTTDDPSQPSTTAYISSDDAFNQSNSISQFNGSIMQTEYQMMSLGQNVGWINGVVSWAGQRMADKVGIYGDPSFGTTGGMSAAQGYGPYNLAPGQSFHIVMAEAAAGLSREACIRVGHKFKWGEITASQKDDSVYTGRDSLFQTFRRAIANYHSGYNIPQPPLPPSTFTVTSGGDRISLSWAAPQGGPTVTGYNIYRAEGLVDSAYTLLYHAAPGVTSYNDMSAIRGFDYYYYITSVGDAADNNGGGNTPAGVALESGRYYTQTYDPAKLLRPGVSEPVRVTLTVDSSYSKSNTLPQVYSVYTNSGSIFTVQSFNLTSGPTLKIRKLPNGQVDTFYTVSGSIKCNGTGEPSSGGELTVSKSVGPDTIYFSAVQKSGASLGDVIRIVPNPFNISASQNVLRYPGEPNQIAFLNIPPECTIKIYTELGQLIKTLQHTNGSGDEYWDCTTSSNQIVVSGVYIVVFQTPKGQTAIKKFVVIR